MIDILKLMIMIICIGACGGCARTTQYAAASQEITSNRSESEQRWFPKMAAPRGIVQTTDINSFDEVRSTNGQSSKGPMGAGHMMVQSLAGLAAQAVNRGDFDELVWVNNGPSAADKNPWFKQIRQKMKWEDRGTFAPYELLDRYIKAGLVKGYVLYDFDYSPGGVYTRRPTTDQSVNVATVAAGLLGGVLMEAGQQAQAEQRGLKLLLDARGKTLKWCFDTYRDRLNRNLLLTVDPKVPQMRDMAIAFNTMALYDTGDPMPEILAWLEPLTPVLGWNCGNEDEHTGPPTHEGHFQTASNWVFNLPVLMAGANQRPCRKLTNLNPASIDYQNGRHFTSFLMSDGDNLGLMLAGFPQNKNFWAHPLHGQFPFGWTTCVSHLTQLCPEALNALAETAPAGSSVFEHGGGYYYPDQLAKNRPNRPQILRLHARRMSNLFARNGCNMLSFICSKVESPEAMEAYEIYAKEIDGLAGMIAIQYAPYDGGNGKIFWVKNADGVEIPVVTVKFSIWNNAPWPRGGTPAKVANLINLHAQTLEEYGHPSYSVTAVHAWSRFQQAEGASDIAENVPRIGKTDEQEPGGELGLGPVQWCIGRLDPMVKVVSPEELFWRLRMEHNPRQTNAAIKKLQREKAPLKRSLSSATR